MKEEDIIRKHDTGRNPFRTPDGYFDHFTERLMRQLPPLEEVSAAKPVRISLVRRIRRYAAAAVVAGLCIGVGAYLLRQPSSANDPLLASESELYSNDYIDEALDYEMVDNNQIAYYLTEAY